LGPELQWAVLLAGTFAGGFATGLAGFAYALVTAAFFLHVLDPVDAVAVTMIGTLLGQATTIWRFRAAMDPRRLLPFLVPGLAGVPVGTWLLASADAGTVRDAIGAFLVAYALYAIATPRLVIGRRGGRVADGAVGFAGGILGGLAGLSGALPTIWAGMRGWSRDEQRAVYQPFIVVVQVGRDALEWVAKCLPAFALGLFLGMRAYARIDEHVFRRVVLGMLLASGSALVLF
jgi:uncharacterized membrane protein YfcA